MENERKNKINELENNMKKMRNDMQNDMNEIEKVENKIMKIGNKIGNKMFEVRGRHGERKRWIDPKSFMKIIAFLDKEQYIVTQSENWSELSPKGVMHLQVVGRQYKIVPTHDFIVIHVALENQLAVIKCHCYEVEDAESEFFVASQIEDIQARINNYRDIKSYLDSRRSQFPNITLNPFCVIEVRSHQLWCELEIPKFQKFLADGESKVSRIANTTSKELQRLQDYVYYDSNYKKTIVNLKGGFMEEKTNQSYILTDVQFTNTLTRLGWTEQSLLNAYVPGYTTRSRYCLIL